MKSYYLLFAGLINLGTAILHVIGGQISLIQPLLKADLETQVKAELLGAWHMVTLILLYTSYVILRNYVKKIDFNQIVLLRFIGYLYVGFGLPSIITSFFYGLLAPQWILLIPIGIFILIGIRKANHYV